MNLYSKNTEVLKSKIFGNDLVGLLENVIPEEMKTIELDDIQPYIDKTLAYNGITRIDELRSVVILGFEFGIMAKYLLQHCGPTTIIIVMDTDLPKLKYALSENDYTEWLQNPRLVFGAEERMPLIKRLQMMFYNQEFTILSNRIHYLEQPFYDLTSKEYSKRLKQIFIDARQGFLAILGNSPDDTIKGIRNIIHNVGALVRSFPLKLLQGKYEGVPAICVAAGPSLEKNISVLEKLQGRALILAADTISDKLTKHGIVPDIMSSLERDEQVYEGFYKGRHFSERTVFVGTSLVDQRISNEYPGRMCLVSPFGMPMDNWLKDTIETITFLNPGKSVAHLNYSIARFLGCQPIVLIGQDLAYGESGNTHVKGTYDENERFKNEPNTHHQENRFEVPGFFGEPVITNRWWDLFRKWFEEEIHFTPWHVINATEGGSYIHGADHIPLQEVFERYCDKPLSLDLPFEVEYQEADSFVEETFNKITSKVQVLLKNNREQQTKLETLQKQAKWLLKESNWINNRLNVLNKIVKLDQELTQIVRVDSNLAQTVQYYNFLYKSQMNRIVELVDFRDVELAYQHLTDFIDKCMEYSKKIESLYITFTEKLEHNYSIA